MMTNKRLDYHPSFQVIAFLIEETGEYGECGVPSTHVIRLRGMHYAYVVKTIGRSA